MAEADNEPGPEPEWPKEELKAQYSEAGEWARHFSNVRMTVTPVLMGLSLAIMQFALTVDTVGDNEETIAMLSSLILWIAAISILFTFTRSTLRAMQHWVHIQSLLFRGTETWLDRKDVLLFEKGVSLLKDFPAWLGLILTLLYGAAWGSWAWDALL